ncbi:MAG: TetR family transcriptional regulator [Actinophytocola sp.]|uniref:ScbR family autoregulator-binding transcription factor n=1 Tax=Actinophytocola sp. TaxID=1872138 RepID=UPI00132C7537|nr:ScbR family autoregulator-binding transcription factor [Actinophytocola sp.]MPZ82122.1 TetR family transcriptional regulator [Actinophytocola sp.]
MPRQDRAERTRNAILDAAAAVFDQRGFAGASLSEILAKAGVTKGALYFHFSSKEELASALVSEQWNFEFPQAADYSSKLQALIDVSHVFGQNLCSNIRVSASNRLVTEANVSSPAPAVYERWIEIVHELIVAAQEAGDIRKEWDPMTIATWLTGAFLGVQTMSGVLTNRADLRDRITDMWRIALPGLAAPRRLSRFIPAGTIQWDSSAA